MGEETIVIGSGATPSHMGILSELINYKTQVYNFIIHKCYYGLSNFHIFFQVFHGYLTMLSSPLISHFVYFVRLFYLFIYLLFISYLLTLIWSLNSDDQIANHPNSRPLLVSAPRHPPHPPPPRRDRSS